MSFRFALLVIFLVAICGGSSSSRADQPGFVNTYVATNGVDLGNTTCSSVSPCASIPAAQARTATGGTITCLSAPTSNQTYFIASSVIIDCSSVNYVLTGAIVISLPSNDSLQMVRLRGFTSNGTGVVTGTLLTITAANTVILENMSFVQGVKLGILDQRTSPGTLRITNSTVSRNTGPGIVIAGASGNVAILDNVTSDGNLYGLAVGAGNKVSVDRSVFSNNKTAGVEGDGGAQVVVETSTIGQNNIGVQSNSSVQLSNDYFTFNTTAVSGNTGTFGNNKFTGNTSDGTALTPVGSVK